MAGFVLYAGGRISTVAVVSAGAISTTDAALFNNAYSQEAIYSTNPASRMRGYLYNPAGAPLLVPFAAATGHTYFFHFYAGPSFPSYPDALGDILELIDASGNPWIKASVNYSAGGGLQLFFNSGTGGSPVWTAINATPTSVGGVNFTLDIEIALAASGPHTVSGFVNGVLVIPATAVTAAGLGLGGFDLLGPQHGGIAFSEIICTEDVSTVGAHVFASRPNAAGAHSNWTGTYVDVDAAGTQTTNHNQATAAGLLQSYGMSDVTVPAGYAIGAVFNWLYAKNAGGAPANISAICRPAGTDHVSGNLKGITAGFGGIGSRYDVNPDTSVAWTQSDWNATEMGFESAT